MEKWGQQICVTKHEVDRFKKLVQHWWNCIEVRGDFVEK